ncbi:UNKNOWN [Stylonychia lemnae]|uniref:Transmembrane protein n=1 Tax=Stylonychia lemnae TaxID=5949 RepID=A0A078BC69_STYLE|nr:UNKNOWN [Stylonychia lemnae]|eukprot:CDW91193.1 UNKNOWN [Stylonychia lemnae]
MLSAQQLVISLAMIIHRRILIIPLSSKYASPFKWKLCLEVNLKKLFKQKQERDNLKTMITNMKLDNQDCKIKGLIYSNNPNASIRIQNLTVKNFVTNGQLLNSQAFNAKILIQNSSINCFTPPLSNENILDFDGSDDYYLPLIFVQNQVDIWLNSNTFQNCYLFQQGSLITVIESTLSDTFSSYINCSSMIGGVYNIQASNISILNLTTKNIGASIGGLIYLNQSSNLSISGLFAYQELQSKKQGALIYAETNQEIQIFSKIKIEGSTLINNLVVKNDGEGGLIYVDGEKINIEINGSGQIVLEDNIFKCSLTSNYNEEIFNLAYLSYANQGGAIYCENCNISLIKSTFQDSLANEGGVIYSIGQNQISITNSSFNNSISFTKGGFIALYQDQSAFKLNKTLLIENTIYNKTFSYDNGGGIYCENAHINIQLRNISQYNSASINGEGGFIHAKASSNIIIVDSLIQDYFSSINASALLSYSNNIEILINGTVFEQTPQYLQQFDQATDEYFSQFGALMLQDCNKIIFKNNQFRNNFRAKFAGAVYVSNCSFLDFGSVYFNNQAEYGGGIYLQGTQEIYIDSAIFDENLAKFKGGSISINNSVGNAFLKNVSIENSQSQVSAGLSYEILRNLVFGKNIQQKLTIQDSYFNNLSSSYASAMYLSSWSTTFILNSVQISNSKCEDNGLIQVVEAQNQEQELSLSKLRTSQFEDVILSEDPEKVDALDTSGTGVIIILTRRRRLEQEEIQEIKKINLNRVMKFISAKQVMINRMVFQNCNIPDENQEVPLIQTMKDTQLFIDTNSIYLNNKGTYNGLYNFQKSDVYMINNTYINLTSILTSMIIGTDIQKFFVDNCYFKNHTSFATNDNGGIFKLKNTTLQTRQGNTTIRNFVDVRVIKAGQKIIGGSLFEGYYGDFRIEISSLVGYRKSFFKHFLSDGASPFGQFTQDSIAIIRDSIIDLKYDGNNYEEYKNQIPYFYGGLISSQSGSLQTIRCQFIGSSLNGPFLYLVYTNYQDVKSTFIDFVSESQYDETSGIIYCNFCSMILDKTIIKNNKVDFSAIIYSYFGIVVSMMNMLIQNNTGDQGSILKITNVNEQEMSIPMMIIILNCKIYDNKAQQGGFIYSNAQLGDINIIFSEFKNNQAAHLGGIAYFVYGLNFTMINCKIEDSYASQGSIIYSQAIGLNITLSMSDNEGNFLLMNAELIKLEYNIFEYCGSQQYGGVFNLQNSTLVDSGSKFRYNSAIFGGVIYSSNSSMNFYGTQFLNNLAYEGGVFQLTTSSTLMLENCDSNIANENSVLQVIGSNTLLNIQGAFVQLAFEANLDIVNSIFRNGHSQVGGALFITGMSSVKISNSQFISNIAFDKGGAIYAQSFADIYIGNQTSFINNKAIQDGGGDLYLTNSDNQVILSQVSLTSPNSQNSIHVQNSKFMNLQGTQGGAIYIEEVNLYQQQNSANTNIQRYSIQKSLFINCSAVSGGAIFTNNQESLVIRDSIFKNNSAIASIEDIEQIKQDNNSKFKKNFAVIYGDDIGTFGFRLQKISQEQYKYQIQKLANFTIRELIEQNNEQYYDSDDLLQKNNEETQIPNLRSGGQSQEIYIALVDKYGQIVGSDFKNKVRINFDTSNLSSSQSLYPPFIEGQSIYELWGGVVVIKDINFTGNPGQSYELILTTDAIDESKLSIQEQLKNSGNSNYKLEIEISFRGCIAGEYFTSAGKCVECQNSYSLEIMTSPNRCKLCPTGQAICLGGNIIGPKPGYWRVSNDSDKFVSCIYQKACIGLNQQTHNYIGDCKEGYQGLLCAECIQGYSRNSNHQCLKCPKDYDNVIRLIAIVIFISLFAALIVRQSIIGVQEAKNVTSIYLRILLNHFQLMILTSSFKFQWSEEIQNLFSITENLGQISTQLFSIDCLLDKRRIGQIPQDQIQIYDRLYFQKLMLITMVPLLIFGACYSFWKIYQSVSKKSSYLNVKIKMSIVILLFLVHPTLVRYSLSHYRCLQIGDQSKLYDDLNVECGDMMHNLVGYLICMPNIVIWGIGIPLGYRLFYYYWEVVIMYRKIIILFVSIFVSNYGITVQALLMLFVLILKLYDKIMIKQKQDIENMIWCEQLENNIDQIKHAFKQEKLKINKLKLEKLMLRINEEAINHIVNKAQIIQKQKSEQIGKNIRSKRQILNIRSQRNRNRFEGKLDEIYQTYRKEFSSMTLQQLTVIPSIESSIDLMQGRTKLNWQGQRNTDLLEIDPLLFQDVQKSNIRRKNITKQSSLILSKQTIATDISFNQSNSVTKSPKSLHERIMKNKVMKSNQSLKKNSKTDQNINKLSTQKSVRFAQVQKKSETMNRLSQNKPQLPKFEFYDRKYIKIGLNQDQNRIQSSSYVDEETSKQIEQIIINQNQQQDQSNDMIMIKSDQKANHTWKKQSTFKSQENYPRDQWLNNKKIFSKVQMIDFGNDNKDNDNLNQDKKESGLLRLESIQDDF